jgi:hypothetical protein
MMTNALRSCLLVVMVASVMIAKNGLSDLVQMVLVIRAGMIVETTVVLLVMIAKDLIVAKKLHSQNSSFQLRASEYKSNRMLMPYI